MKDSPLTEYDYILPEENIRNTPLVERDQARLFVYDTKTDTVTYDIFKNIAKHLPPDGLMILNNTGVIPARVIFTKDTGGRIEGLFLMNEGWKDGAIAVIVDKPIFPGRKLYLDEFEFLIKWQDEQRFYLEPLFDPTLLDAVLHEHGVTPTPKYLGRPTLTEQELRERYQTVFAEGKKSVAAPTASLHFTDHVFYTLREKGVRDRYITLDVGMGTFATVTPEHIRDKKLHKERYSIASTVLDEIKQQKRDGKPVISVGTTTTRTLESERGIILGDDKSDTIIGETDIFILPPYEFGVVDIMITNFHVPKSSLMALVDAFLKHKGAKRGILSLYEQAKLDGFMFYSFGDSMLIL